MSLHTSISSNASRAATALFGFILTAVASAPAHAQTPVVFGDTITEPGFYFLAGNQSGAGTGIVIDSDDVVLLLSRFTLRGSGVKGGVVSIGHSNLLIAGGRITNFATGVALFDCDHVTVRDIRCDNHKSDGIFLSETSDSWFTRVRCDQNGGNGVYGIAAKDNRFLSILAHDNEANGILLDFQETGMALGPVAGRSTDNKIKLCWAAYNSLDGIRLIDADDNDVERNQCVNNNLAGIRLGTVEIESLASALAPEGSQDNFLRSNWCVFNHDGVLIEKAATNNTMTNNTALANFGRDVFDDNSPPPCANIWFLNFFLTRGGAGAGCIF